MSRLKNRKISGTGKKKGKYFMEKSIAAREKRFQVKPFKRVAMYDPWYGNTPEKLRDGAANICTFCKLPVSNREAEVVLREVHGTFDYDGKKIPYTNFEVRFFSYRKDIEFAKKEVEAECKNMCYPTLIKEKKELGCDTARFMVCVDENELEIYTGADGIYGRMAKYKNNYAYYFEFFLDGDITDWVSLEEKIKFLFQVKNEQESADI
jgi:hypothetical protein